MPSTTTPDAPDDKPKVAVALKYTHKVDPAPRVIAKGEGAIAEQIRAIAESRGIAINKDADLAQLLMAVDLDSPIPIEAYEAVARILSYIYRANQQLRTAGTAP